jgi:hypothetical protein
MARAFHRHPARVLITAQLYTRCKWGVLLMFSRMWPYQSMSERTPSPPPLRMLVFLLLAASRVLSAGVMAAVKA